MLGFDRVATFYIDQELLDYSRKSVLDLFRRYEIVILRAEYRMDHRAIEYLGYSKFFPVKKQGYVTPVIQIHQSFVPDETHGEKLYLVFRT